MKVKAVVFDFDDTLVNTFNVRAKALVASAKKFYDLDITVDDVRRLWGKPYLTLLSELHRQAEPPEQIHEKYMSIRTDFPVVYNKGLPDLFDQLHEQGYELGVLTSSGRAFVDSDMELLKFPRNKFSKVQTAEDTNVHKPDPEVFAPMLESLREKSIEKREVLYVGDSLSDHAAASGAGLNFIAVTTGLTSPAEFTKLEAKQIEDLSQLLEHLN